MGASESKLGFKHGVFKLSEQHNIPQDDPYWAGFWQLPEGPDDVFSLFSSADIRRIRDEALGNLESLIRAVTSRLFALRNNRYFPDPKIAPERDALNCIRVLTRILPFIYETEHLESWEDNLLWHHTEESAQNTDTRYPETRSDAEYLPLTRSDNGGGGPYLKPIGEQLIDTLIELLFLENFTIPKSSTTIHNKFKLTIWQKGVGCNEIIGSGKEMESNRAEILRLFLTLSSKSMYMQANILPVQGVKAITYITTTADKQLVLTLLCSLLNTTLTYNPATWRVPYDHVVFKDSKQVFVTYCLHFLLVLILYPVPEATSGAPPKNYFRYFLGKVHRIEDFQFLADGMTRILNQPLQATTAVLPGSQKSLIWAPEMVMLFWETLQCNKRFRSFLVDTDRVHDLMIFVLFQIMEHQSNPARQGIVRMCVFVLQTLSVEPAFGVRLNKTFNSPDSLPPTLRVAGFHGTYMDFLTISIHNIIRSNRGKTDAIFPALLAILNNVAPYATGLSLTSSSKLIQTFLTMSSPSFLLANEVNHELLRSMLEALNAVVEHQYTNNPSLLLVISKAHKRIAVLENFAETGAQDELERLERQRKEVHDEQDRSHGQDDGRVADSLRSSVDTTNRSLSELPEDTSAFTIGEDDYDSDSEEGLNPVVNSQASPIGDASVRSESAAGPVDSVIPSQMRGLSEKARGKLPVRKPVFSRQNSSGSLNFIGYGTASRDSGFEPTMAWVDSWARDLPLQTMLAVMRHIDLQLARQHGSSLSTMEMLQIIQNTAPPHFERSPIRVHLFEWTPLSLGWYESVLWGFIFSREMTESRGSAGIWKGTIVKLFRIQDSAVQGPSFLAPRGAVDAVGSNLVSQTIGRLNLRGAAPSLARST